MDAGRGDDAQGRGRLWAAIAAGVRVALLSSLLLAVVSLQFGTGLPALDESVDRLATNVTDPVTADTATPDTTTDGTVDGANSTRIERLVHEEINERRTERGLSRLRYDSALAAIAEDHSEDMIQRDYFAHVGPDGDDVTDRYREAGYTCRVSAGGNRYATGGENLAQSWWKRRVATDGGTAYYDTERGLATGIVDQWMNSTAHRENILRPYWEREGIGVKITADGKVLATQNFC